MVKQTVYEISIKYYCRIILLISIASVFSFRVSAQKNIPVDSVRSLLIGTWQSALDKNDVWVFNKNTMSEYYNSKEEHYADTDKYKIVDSIISINPPSFVKSYCIVRKEKYKMLYYEIDDISDNYLTLIFMSSGRNMEFVRLK